MGRPRIPKEKKIALLSSIRDKKHILFSKCASEVEKLTIRNVWNDILLQAKAMQLVSPEKNWQYLRDQVYSVWKAKSLAKLDKFRKGGCTGGRAPQQLDEVDEMIFEIINPTFPVGNGHSVEDNGPSYIMAPMAGFSYGAGAEGPDVKRYPQPSSLSSSNFLTSSSSPSCSGFHDVTSPKKNSSLLTRKRKLEIQLLKLEVQRCKIRTYREQLECYRLEKELGLSTSQLTSMFE